MTVLTHGRHVRTWHRKAHDARLFMRGRGGTVVFAWSMLGVYVGALVAVFHVMPG